MGEEQWKALPGLPGCVPAADWPIHRSCRSRCPGLESRQPGKAQHGRAGTFLSLIRTSPIWPNREKRHRVSWCSRYFRALTFGWVRFRVERENLPKKQKKTPQIRKKKKPQFYHDCRFLVPIPPLPPVAAAAVCASNLPHPSSHAADSRSNRVVESQSSPSLS